MKRTKFVNALHCALRPSFKTEPLHTRLLLWATGALHYSFGDATLSASPLIDRQLSLMPGARKRQVIQFLPTYAPNDFLEVKTKNSIGSPTMVLYAGRIERSKGVFDLLEAAETLEQRHGADAVVFEVCGEGNDLGELRRLSAARGMSHSFRVHGFCNRVELSGRFATADLVVVPTRTEFEEGFAMIVAEGITAGIPVITSRVCPALEVVSPACMEVQPDDPQAYADAITALMLDPSLYEAKRQAAATLRTQFFDTANSYGAKLKPILEKLILGKTQNPETVPEVPLV